MRTKWIIWGLAMTVCALFAACDDKEDNDGDSNTVKEKTILEKYPEAKDIAWSKSKDNKYDIATFTLTKTKVAEVNIVKMWFGKDNAIRLVDQEISFAQLPESVKNSFEKNKCDLVEGNIRTELIGTNYSDKQIWELDDVYKLERDGAVSYKLEMEAVKYDNVEINLYYDEQGILLKESLDDEDEVPLEIPEHIREWIKKNYKDVVVLDYEMEEEEGAVEYELDLKDGKIILEITLIEKNGKLVIDEEEYNYPTLDVLPESVLQEVEIQLVKVTERYGMTEADIDGISMEVIGGIEKYTVEFEKGDKEVIIRIAKDSTGKIDGSIIDED